MLCKNPFMDDAVPRGCGQCTPCRVNKSRQWTHRIMLESMCHEDNAFITLTYSPEHLPENGSLIPQDLKNWQKNLRYHSDLDPRFFSVGEYGDQTKRPHYHAAVFGYKGCNSIDPRCACIYCKTLRASWKKGHVLNGTLTKDSASYIAGYVTKKLTDRDPYKKYEKLKQKGYTKSAEEYKKRVIDELDGKHPEFARMSLGKKNHPDPRFQGGIGYGSLDTIQDMLETEFGCELIGELNDVPDIIKIGGKEMLLGQYLKNKLRERIGIDEKTKKQKMSQLREEKIQEYLLYRQEETEKRLQEIPTITLSQKEFILDKHLQKVRNLEKRFSNNKNKGTL